MPKTAYLKYPPPQTLTLNSDVKGAAGSAVLVLSQAAVLSVSLRCDLHDVQHRQLISRDSSYKLSIFQPGKGGGWAALGAAVQGQRGAFHYCHGLVYLGLTRRVCKEQRRDM